MVVFILFMSRRFPNEKNGFEQVQLNNYFYTPNLKDFLNIFFTIYQLKNK